MILLGENFDTLFLCACSGNAFFLVNSESIGADTNYFFKCRDDVCAEACLFFCKFNVDAAAGNVCSNSASILLVLCTSFSRQTMTLRLLRARLSHTKRNFDATKSISSDMILSLLRASFNRGIQNTGEICGRFT